MRCMILKSVVKPTCSNIYHVFLVETSQSLSLGFEINKLYAVCPCSPLRGDHWDSWSSQQFLVLSGPAMPPLLKDADILSPWPRLWVWCWGPCSFSDTCPHSLTAGLGGGCEEAASFAGCVRRCDFTGTVPFWVSFVFGNNATVSEIVSCLFQDALFTP